MLVTSIGCKVSERAQLRSDTRALQRNALGKPDGIPNVEGCTYGNLQIPGKTLRLRP